MKSRFEELTGLYFILALKLSAAHYKTPARRVRKSMFTNNDIKDIDKTTTIFV